jgi:hypothetical protein
LFLILLVDGERRGFTIAFKKWHALEVDENLKLNVDTEVGRGIFGIKKCRAKSQYLNFRISSTNSSCVLL